MIQKTSRVEFANGIKFYEQDILYDNYIYSGSSTIDVTLDYKNPGFGIAFISSTSSTLDNSNAVLLFRIRNKTLEIIYKENDSQSILGTYNATSAKTVTENLKFTIKKEINSYTITIGTKTLATFNCSYEMDSYYIGYYSNKDNIIKHINIASAVPYGWIVNMNRTNGGYIEFYKDAFELKYCNGLAELEQINIALDKGKYYLKYDSIDSDVIAYVMNSEDKRDNDDEKNILQSSGSFELAQDSKVSLKFKASKGRVQNITITSSIYNEYLRTSPDYSYGREIDNSYIELYLHRIKSFSFKGEVLYVPGTIHKSPTDYAVIDVNDKKYGLYDLNIATNVAYNYKYENNILTILNQRNEFVCDIEINNNILTIFNNLNGKIKNFVVITEDGEEIDLTVENTIKKYLPGAIKSPIVVVDKSNNEPLDLSSSYRWFYKNNKKYYVFTNTEREYFLPNYRIVLDSPILDKLNSVIVYGIKKYSDFNLDELLHIEKEGKDTIDYCANSYDVLFEADLNSINKSTGEIRLNHIDDYKYIIVDYIKDNSYCINYRYELNSFEIDIAVSENKDIYMHYDNIIQYINNSIVDEYISSKNYYNTGLSPSVNCYITIGGDTKS